MARPSINRRRCKSAPYGNKNLERIDTRQCYTSHLHQT
jgi:hypothetical protein